MKRWEGWIALGLLFGLVADHTETDLLRVAFNATSVGYVLAALHRVWRS